MIRLMFACCLLMLIASCGEQINKKKLAVKTEAAIDTSAVLPVEEPEPLRVVEDIIPVTADESFSDFFYNFASDSVFQRSRIITPLPFYEGERVERYTKETWKFDPLFSREEVYTILFDTEEDMELEKDTSAHSVQVDWLYLQDRVIKRYYFERKNDSWFLEAINMEKMKEPKDTREDFYDFYRHFVADSLFQDERLNDPLLFVTADPDDEFEIIETVLDKGQWFAFRPPMPVRLSNIRYGQKDMPDPSVKIVEFKGFGNGFSNVLHFHCRHGIWKLVKFEDLSD